MQYYAIAVLFPSKRVTRECQDTHHY